MSAGRRNGDDSISYSERAVQKWKMTSSERQGGPECGAYGRNGDSSLHVEMISQLTFVSSPLQDAYSSTRVLPPSYSSSVFQHRLHLLFPLGESPRPYDAAHPSSTSVRSVLGSTSPPQCLQRPKKRNTTHFTHLRIESPSPASRWARSWWDDVELDVAVVGVEIKIKIGVEDARQRAKGGGFQKSKWRRSGSATKHRWRRRRRRLPPLVPDDLRCIPDEMKRTILALLDTMHADTSQWCGGSKGGVCRG